MISGRSVIAIVPARAGSKGLPNKNRRNLCGKPLLQWSLESAMGTASIDRVVLSTDSEGMAGIGRACGLDVPFLRPPELANDTATSISVVEHALNYFQNERGETYDYTMLLEPTSPLRESDDLAKMLTILDARWEDFDAIVSVGRAPCHPSIMKRSEGDKLTRYDESLEMTTRRQDDDRLYFPYGVAYIAKTAALLAERTFYVKRSTWYEIQRYQEYEIDDLYDFVCVEAVMKHEWGVE